MTSSGRRSSLPQFGPRLYGMPPPSPRLFSSARTRTFSPLGRGVVWSWWTGAITGPWTEDGGRGRDRWSTLLLSPSCSIWCSSIWYCNVYVSQLLESTHNSSTLCRWSPSGTTSFTAIYSIIYPRFHQIGPNCRVFHKLPINYSSNIWGRFWSQLKLV